MPLVARVLGTFHRFFATSAAGGIVLLLCAAVALVWANSPWSAAYHHLWETPFTVGTPGFGLTLSLHGWVNDGLMALFFFLVGLEIKREVLVGELSNRRTASLPVAAAIGGMVVPALLYLLFNRSGEGSAGWGIPMATDIAFALGILALLGDRVPKSLRIFLAALAIADDLGAVLVIAIFYTSQLHWDALAAVGLTMTALVLTNRFGVRSAAIYAALGIITWVFMLKSGVHATIAGVLVALTVPARAGISAGEFVDFVQARLVDVRAAADPDTSTIVNEAHLETLYSIEHATLEASAPLTRMEHALHGLVAFCIMPLFALANAGVSLGIVTQALTDPVAIGIMVGLMLGKPLGIMSATLAVLRFGYADLPRFVTLRHIHGAAWLGGIGFTMSLFIASLAFANSPLLEIAKVGVLTASIGAGVVGFLILRSSAPLEPES